MNWTRSETLALAKQACSLCYGLGLRPGRNGVDTPCNCVFRAIFRACHNKFQKCVEGEGGMTSVHFNESQNFTRRRHRVYGFKNQEFIVDFLNVAKRVLGENTAAHRLFKFHFLLGADWKLCCKKLGVDRGEFFHDVYRIQQKLGRAFRELEPHALYPLDEYFGGNTRRPAEAKLIDRVFPLATGPQEPLTAPLQQVRRMHVPLATAAA